MATRDKTTGDREFLRASPDRPGVNPNTDDKLGYASFAKNLATSIAQIPPTDGLVIGLYGAWGLGKSTVLNFVEFEIEAAAEPKPTVVRFDPWWFSGQEDLTHAFFNQLLATLRPVTKGKKNLRVDLDRLEKYVDDFADVTSEFEIPYASRAASIWKKLRQRTLTQRKEELEEALKALSQRILLIVDDIDRLVPGEIRHLFRLIKAVADFPNITYLVAFDRRVVTSALREEGLTGRRLSRKNCSGTV